jgi:hypothetical protein
MSISIVTTREAIAMRALSHIVIEPARIKQTVIDIIVESYDSRHSDQSPSPGRYRVRLADGEILLASVRVPFFAAARALLWRGHEPSQMLEMRHAGSSIIALRQPLGDAAKLTVEEPAKSGPLIRRWKPFPVGGGEATG